MAHSDNSRFLPLFLLLTLSLIWGSSFLLMKRGLEVYSYTQVAALRIFFAFIVMVFFGLRAMRKVPKKDWKWMAISGFTGNFIPAFMFAIAITQLPSSLTGVLNSLTPMFTLVIGVIAFGIAWRKLQVAGIVLGLLGAAGLSLIRGDGAVGSFNLYVVFVVIATICYALNANFLKKFLSDYTPITITGMSMTFVGPLATVYLFSTDFLTRLETPGAWEAMAYLAALGIIGTSFALILFNRLVHLTSAVFASSVTYVIPVIAVLLGVLDGESLFPLHYAAIALILGGVYLVNSNRSQKA